MLSKAHDYLKHVRGSSAFVATNSLNQGRQVSSVWPLLLTEGFEILFAHRSFKWANLAARNAGVTVSVIGYGVPNDSKRYLYSEGVKQKAVYISPYLTSGHTKFVKSSSKPISEVNAMNFGSMPNDGGGLLLTYEEVFSAIHDYGVSEHFIFRVMGSKEFIRGHQRYCLWISDDEAEMACNNTFIKERVEHVHKARVNSNRATTKKLANIAYRFGEVRQQGNEKVIIIPKVSSESREYLPVGYVQPNTIVTDLAFTVLDAPLWNFALIASRIHLVWVATVCGKLKTDFRYSNTLGWNTFPISKLTGKNKEDLTRCVEDILLAREAHFPATIADLYVPENMPDDLRRAHERNDEVLERIYIGRRFKNDTERLEKLFDLYTKMTSENKKLSKPKKKVAQK